jgi:hypothetical protein
MICSKCFAEFYEFNDFTIISDLCRACQGIARENERRKFLELLPARPEQQIPRRVLGDWRAKGRDAKTWATWRLRVS